MQNDIILVVGGTVEQSKDYINVQDDPTKYKVLSDIRGVFGMRNVKIQPVGTFYKRRDWYELELEAKRRNIEVLDYVGDWR